MKRLILFSFSIFIISCAEKLIQEPENLIPADKMIDILNDMTIVNTAKSTNNKKLEKSGIETMSFIFEKYNIDSAQFVDSDRYYASRPVEYESIYSKLETRLENEAKRLKEIKNEKDSLLKLQRDSLKNKNRNSDTLKENLSKNVQK